jgi:two-component system chemotaxis sensor kinase CheA
VSIDLSQFYQVFFEETAEHLETMESLLLGLDVGAPDTEQLNAIFRAAHSIKGSSGTFGFSDMADVTHVLENLLDRIRKGELALRDEMIDAFLAAGDVLKTLLAAHKGEDEADPAVVDATCARLRALTGEGGVRETPRPPPANTEGGCRVQFVIDGDPASHKATMDNLLAELAAHGEVRIVAAPAGEGQPYQVDLLGHPELDQVRGILEFVARSDSIRIDALGADPPLQADADGAYGFFAEAEAAAAEAADDGAYGLFEPAGEASAPAAVEEGFGFFEPLPEAPVAAAPATPAGGDGYGFFEPVAAPATATPAPPTPTAEKAPAEKPAAPPEPAGKPAPAKAAAAATDTTIRVGVEKVDQLINLVGELVITQAMLLQSATAIDLAQHERLHAGLSQLERNSRDLQEAVMSIRMMPISVVFSRFPRVVREVSQKLGKKVELKLVGEGTELDKSLIERLADPLTHLIRNSLDHGIEAPDVRAAKGKQPVGTITLKAYHQSGNIVIEVSDDGAGLNRQKILAKAKERGLAAHDQMSDHEVWQLIFEAGFSTADTITEVSGRGVGMDVVKRNIYGMGGRVEIDSMLGVGTRMTVRLPLTLAILDGMSVAVGGETYILPLGYVVESLQATDEMMKSISGIKKLLFVRGEYVPVVPLFEVFGVADAITEFARGIMVIIEANGMKTALFVDALVGQQQVVIKSLEANYRKVSGVSGATIMGDGHVALILDVAVLANMGRAAGGVV